MSPSGGMRRPRSLRTARLIAGGFIGAFGLSILTVVYTGLNVGAPRGPKTAATVATARERAAVRQAAAARRDEAKSSDREHDRNDADRAPESDGRPDRPAPDR
jgi:hypothetical protein